MKHFEKWITIALVNLSIVASLGLLMRAKMIFSMPFIDFKNTLHAHSHFAFSGWITLALLALMVSQMLPLYLAEKKVYKRLLSTLLLAAVGMLVSFPFQGYGLYSISFSTLFIFATYGFAYVFLKDLRQTNHNKAIKMLTVSALAYLVVSSLGPFTLAYAMVTQSADAVLYKNAIYTYLHLQYSGFFTLSVFALALHNLRTVSTRALWFIRLLVYSVVPSMFASYLWSYNSMVVYTLAIVGSIMLVLNLVCFFAMLPTLWPETKRLQKLTIQLGALSMAAFVLKTTLQIFTIIPALGELVFANRPIIIGFLHLVLLGFISIYILAHLVQSRYIPNNFLAKLALGIFIAGIAINELILMTQGVRAMMMKRTPYAQELLLGAAACLFIGACSIAIIRIYYQIKPPEKISLNQ